MKKHFYIFIIFFISFSIFSLDIKEFKNDNAKINQYRSENNFNEAAKLSLKWAKIFENENKIKEAAIFYGATAKDLEVSYKIDDAIKNYQKAKDLLDKDTKILEDKKIEKIKYIWIMNIGILNLYYKYDTKTAMDYLESSYQYFDKENHFLEKGIVTRCLGVRYRILGNKNKAFEMFDQSMELLRDLDQKEYLNTFGEKLEAFLLEENAKRSLQALENYQNEVFALNDPKTTIKYFLTMSRLTNDLNSKKNYLSYCENNLNENLDINLKINVLLSIANFLVEEQNPDNFDIIISKYEKALEYAKKSNNQRAIFNIQNLIGSAYYEKRDFERCFSYLFDSLKNNEYEIPLETKNTLNINIGISLFYLKKYNDSIKYLESSLKHIEEIRKSIVYSDEKSKKFFIEMETCYKHLILSYIKNQQEEKAFNIYELSKARNFLNNLSIRSAFYNGGVDSSEIDIFNQYVREINILDIKINDVNTVVDKLLEFQKIRKTKVDELTTFILSLENRYPKFAEIRNPKILSFSDAKEILKDNEAMVGFFVSVENYIFILKKSSEKPIAIPLTDEIDRFSNMLIRSMFNSYRVDKQAYNEMIALFLKDDTTKIAMVDNSNNEKTISEKGSRVLKNDKVLSPDEILENIKNLYGYFSRELFKRDIMKNLTNVKNIYLCPDGSFWTMPIEALIAKDPITNKFFVFGERYNVSYIQSLSTIDYLNKKSSISINDENKYDIITFAGAKYPYIKGKETLLKNHFNPNDLKNMTKGIPKECLIKTDGRNQKDYYYKMNHEWKELGYAKSDLMITNEIFKGKAKSYGDAFVSEERIKYLSETNELAKGKILYFSLHGYMDSNNPLMSSIVLTLPSNVPEQDLYENSIIDDGYLNASEISTLKLDNPFVVLSACETGTDKVEGGEGVAGICQSFFIAGAKSVLATLWSIDEKSSYEFMKLFFTKIKSGKNPNIALQETKIEFRKNLSEYLQPIYWAPFILYGTFE
ncbi:MAG TPA: CHAT domain-containing protein [Spirochaetota bacterium]|nr:CHAT domain-containing protein [Spirochaetota bacterium]